MARAGAVYRRHQALDDSLEVYFIMRKTIGLRTWWTTERLIQAMDWEVNLANRRQITRICEALVRCRRAERKKIDSHPVLNLWRVIDETYSEQ